MAEVDTVGLAAVLAADTDLQILLGLSAEPGAHFDELAYADLVEYLERVRTVDALVDGNITKLPYLIV